MIDSAKNDAAIKAALNQNWQDAVTLNEDILKEDTTNIDALNRLGYAFLQLGKPLKAKQIFQKVLKLDRYNRIAINNSKKLSLAKGHATPDCTRSLSPMLFLEDPGKTKIVDCVNPAASAIVSTLICGQEVQLKIKKHSVEIRDLRGSYIGALPDDLAFKLIKFVEEGNTYSAHLRHISKTCISIFLRELTRGKKFIHQPSFSTSVNYSPSVREDTESTNKPDTTETGEEEES